MNLFTNLSIKIYSIEILVIDCYDVDWLESYSLTLCLRDFEFDFLVSALLAVQGQILLGAKLKPDGTASHLPPES